MRLHLVRDKEQRLEKKIIYNCPCGGRYSLYKHINNSANKERHINTKIHKQYLESGSK